ncbi:multiprotein-bridging factor 1 family protein [Pseudomonas monteilii]|jgi:ribosome-binding protein aMBF1 (putative translation factor)
MDVQVIIHEGKPQYAVLPWEHYQALLKAAGHATERETPPAAQADPAPETVAQPTLQPLTELPRLREAKGLARDALARSVGISPAYLAMIESGERQPDAAIRRSLAWELGLPGWSEPS